MEGFGVNTNESYHQIQHPAVVIHPRRATVLPVHNFSSFASSPSSPSNNHHPSSSTTTTTTLEPNSSPSRIIADSIQSSVANVLTWPARVSTKIYHRFGAPLTMAFSPSTDASAAVLPPLLPLQSDQNAMAFNSPVAPSPTCTNSPASSDNPGSPLTNISRSPTPPSEFAAYPSPMSSQLSSVSSSQAASPAPDSREDDSPPAKRRRTSYEPKPRTTQHLDLQTDDVHIAQKDQLQKLLKVLATRRKIVVIAGAGISVSAGIPDFRSSKGLFNSLKKQHNLKSSGKDLFDASVYKDGQSTESFHQMVRQLSSMTKEAQPTPFHHLLATLADEGRLLRLYSQNVDGIDTSLQPLETTVPLNQKGPWPKTIQLHGGLQKMVCSKCHDMKDLDAALFDGPEPPSCEQCVAADNARTEHAGKRSHGVGRLRPRMVLYNEHNPDDEAIGSVVKADLRTRPDCLVVVGTTLKIPGVKRIVKEMCGIIRNRRDGVTIWINKDPPPPSKDYEWDLVVKGPSDSVAHHAAMRRWNEPKPDVVSDEEARKIVAQTTVEVQIPPTPQKIRDAERSLLTPVSSRSTSIPPAKPIEKKLNIIFEMKAKEAPQKKNPAKRGRKPKSETKQKPKSSIKIVKKRKETSSNSSKITFKTTKGATKAPANKKTPFSSHPATPLPSPAKAAPMRPISPVDAKNNALPVELHFSAGEDMESPPFSPITPARSIRLCCEEKPLLDPRRSPKMAIQALLN